MTEERVRERLLIEGLSPHEAERKAALLRATREAVGTPSAGVVDYFVPGRIEVLGKHTDYAGGRSLLCATERGFVVSARPRDDNCVHVTDVVGGVRDEFVLSADQPQRAHWQNYPATVVRRLARNFGRALRGADIAFGSDLPRAAGLSSSTALIIAIAVAILDRNALGDDPRYTASILGVEDLAAYLGSVENGRSFGALDGDTGVGTRGGSQDHTAILCSRAGHVVLYRWAPTVREAESVLPRDCSFVVASSGVTASKTGAVRARYNRGTAVVAALLDLWRAHAEGDPATLGGLAAGPAGALDRLRDMITRYPMDEFGPDELLSRVDQFEMETLQVVPDAAAALAAGDLARFGELVSRSQAGAECGLANQIDETIALVRIARERGAVAASAFGAGFGGSVWALVETNELDRFVSDWRDRYTHAYPDHAARTELFTTRAGPPLVRL